MELFQIHHHVFVVQLHVELDYIVQNPVPLAHVETSVEISMALLQTLLHVHVEQLRAMRRTVSTVQLPVIHVHQDQQCNVLT